MPPLAAQANANELPLASRSAMTGVTFEDRPLALPVQINFRMAMLSASTEMGRSCGKMETYGWRMGSSEQGRVDRIFNATVASMRHQGYAIQSEAPASVSRDITIFTADRLNQHFILMWSAGDVGLVMVVCESSPPLTGRSAAMAAEKLQARQGPLAAQDVIQSAPTGRSEPMQGAFAPVGVWKGEYTCLPQGYTGATLRISRMKGEDFEGDFHFYPTPRNASIPEGRYAVYGQYDRKSHRILINPGKWIRQPKDYANSVMVGSFDVAARTFSAYFQGVNGCTSFEAKYLSAPERELGGASKGTAVKKKRARVKHAQAKPASGTAAHHGAKSRKKLTHRADGLKTIKSVIIGGRGDQGNAAEATPPGTQKMDRDFSSAVSGLGASDRPHPSAKPEAAAPPRAPQNLMPLLPSSPPPSPPPPPSLPLPLPLPLPSSAEPAPDKSGERGGIAPMPDPPQGNAGKSPENLLHPLPQPQLPAPADKEGIKPQGALDPMLLTGKAFRVASGEWISPKAPEAPGPSMISPVAPSAPLPATVASPSIANRIAPAAPGPHNLSAPSARNYVAPEAPAPSAIIPSPGVAAMPSFASAPSLIDPRAPAAPDPEYVSVGGGDGG